MVSANKMKLKTYMILNLVSVKLYSRVVPSHHVTFYMLQMIGAQCVVHCLHTGIPWSCVCMLETVHSTVKTLYQSGIAPFC